MADLYGYLPEELRNPFIKAGHNSFFSKFKKSVSGGAMGRGGDDDETSRSRYTNKSVRKVAKSATQGVYAAKLEGRANIVRAKAAGGDVKAAKGARWDAVKDAQQSKRDAIYAQRQTVAGKKKAKRGGMTVEE